MDCSVITRFHVPRLKSIKLAKFSADREGTKAMTFWKKHPLAREYINNLRRGMLVFR